MEEEMSGILKQAACMIGGWLGDKRSEFQSSGSMAMDERQGVKSGALVKGVVGLRLNEVNSEEKDTMALN
jgi:hypothetical protein